MARSKVKHPKSCALTVMVDQMQLDHLKDLEKATFVTRSEIVQALLARATPDQVREAVIQERGY